MRESERLTILKDLISKVELYTYECVWLSCDMCDLPQHSNGVERAFAVLKAPLKNVGYVALLFRMWPSVQQTAKYN